MPGDREELNERTELDDGSNPDDPDERAHSEERAELEKLRRRIVALDDELIRLVGERRDLVLEIGRLKRELGLPVLDPGREAEVVRRAARRSRDLGVDEELTRDVIWRIIASAREAQEGERGWGPPELPEPEDDRPEDDRPEDEKPEDESPGASPDQGAGDREDRKGAGDGKGAEDV